MKHTGTRTRAVIHLKHIRHNLQYLHSRAEVPLIPMIKANAYGHGLLEVAEYLHQNANALHVAALGVASLDEAVIVRRVVDAPFSIHVYSGAVFSGKKANCDSLQLCKDLMLNPVITSFESLEGFLSRKKLIPFQIKWNTGMNRLGIDWKDGEKVKSCLERRPESWRFLVAMLTHFASAENPQSPLSRTQWQRLQKLKECFHGVRWHFGNSAVIWNAKQFQVPLQSYWVRPGISMYGVAPWPEAERQSPLRPVLEWQAQILQIKEVRPQEKIGYGGTFTNKQKRPILVATLGVGYADGLHRILSNQTLKCGTRTSSSAKVAEEILGRVSMDLTVVKAHPRWKIGDWITLSGGTTTSDLWSLSEKARTMPYEWLTSISPRVNRIYV